MDDLMPIKKLSVTQQLLREARQKAPPLNVPKPLSVDKEFVVINDKTDAKNKPKSLFDRFLIHRNGDTSSLNGYSPPKPKTISGPKWLQLKNTMTQEMESKRLESEKERQLNEKIENEEIDEEVVNELDKVLDDDKEVDENESDIEVNEEEEEEDVDNESNDEKDDEVEDESEAEVNPFVDNEAKEDDEEVFESEDEVENGNQKGFNEENEKNFDKSEDLNEKLSVSDIQNSQLLASEECEDSDSIFNTSITSLNESFERRCATQKIALSPFISQKPKQKNGLSDEVLKLIPKFDSNTDEFNSQTLLDLCSGTFSSQNEPQVSDVNENVINESEDEEDEEIFCSNKRVNKRVNIESEDELDSSDNVYNNDNCVSQKLNLKRFNESDGEELIITDNEEDGNNADNELNDEEQEEEEEEEEVEEETQSIEKLGRGFFEDEAQLSGSDASSDEEEGEDEDDYDNEDEDQEELPTDYELKNQIERIHNKKMLDEDKRQLLLLQDMMFEDGDLHDNTGTRERKFRWNDNEEDDDLFKNDYINEDSEGDYVDSGDESNIKCPTLKMNLIEKQESDTNKKKIV
ncbi:claspin-like [Oppia nitens]|uniref:claspin-like n=1 Tax=Oppia nitens TaxID=1686743 RepID=UPI0023DC24F9|nr:claspin-like [Oppia nitens]